MNNPSFKFVPPSVHQKSFNCPHCGAFSNMDWFTLCVNKIEDVPKIISETFLRNSEYILSNEQDQYYYMRTLSGDLFVGGENHLYTNKKIVNLNVSRCCCCDQISVWVYDKMIWPVRGSAPQPNSDLPDDIKRDYNEASAILDISPRGAAALLRLAVQKLCKHLGEPGGNINDDIKSLVQKGLSPDVQKALDIVRIIGNDAVHPGQIDLRDDRQTAEQLFRLVNFIAEETITRKKHLDALYSSLPESKRQQIERRDGKSPSDK